MIATGCGGSGETPVITQPDAGPHALNVSAGGNQAVCAGGTAWIGPAAHAGYTYSWSPAAGLSATNVAQPGATPSQTTTYQVTVKDPSTGATGSASVTVTVNALPTVSASAASSWVSPGGSTSLTATAGAGTPPYQYGWTASDASCSGGSCFSATNAAQTTVTPQATSDFNVLVTDANGCQAQSQTHVDVAPTLTVSAGADQQVCAGGSVQIGAAAQPGLQYAWSPSADLSSATDAQPTATPSATTTYTLTVTDPVSHGSGTAQMTVTVNGLPSVSPAPAAPLISAGGSTSVVANGTGGTPPYVYAWTATDPSCTGGSCFSDATAAQPDVTPSATSDFSVRITDANGCQAQGQTTVQVAPPLTLATSASLATICSGDSVTLSATPTGGAPAYSYAWTSDVSCTSPGCINDPTSASPTVTLAQTTQFTATVTDSIGATAQNSTSVSVLPDPGLAGADQYVDPGNSTTIGPSAVATASYAWTCNRADCALSLAGGGDPTVDAQPLATPTQSTQYTLDDTTGAGCARHSTATVWVTLGENSIPAPGATYPLSNRLQVQFDQPMLSGSEVGNVALTDDNTGATINATTSYDATSNVLSITPNDPAYLAGNSYTLTLTGGPTGVRSNDPVLANVFANNVEVDFTVGAKDNSAPTVVQEIPANNATSVPINTQIELVLNEPLDPATVTAANFVVTDQNSGGAVIAGTLAYDFVNQTIRFSPSANLTQSHLYKVTVSGLSDLASPANNLATSWQFSTGSSLDTFPPTVSSVTPDGSTSVLINTKVVVVFSETLDSTTTANAVKVVSTTDGSTVSGTSTFNSTTNTLTFTPSKYLAGGTTYQVNVSGAKDIAGNQMVTDTSHSFTTQRVLFSDGFENGTGQWALTGRWGLSTALSLSPTHSLADNTNAKNQNTTATMASALDLSAVTGQVTLLAGANTRANANKGKLFVEVSTDNGATWTLLSTVSGNAGWKRLQLTLPAVSTQTLVRFRQTTASNLGGYKSSMVDEVYLQAP